MENNKKTTPKDIKRPPISTPPIKGSDWIMNGINQLNQRLEGIDGRLRKVENQNSRILGWGSAMFLVLVTLQIVLKFFDIEISLK